MIGQFILMSGILPGGGLAFFDGTASIWYGRMVICLMATGLLSAASSINNRTAAFVTENRRPIWHHVNWAQEITCLDQRFFSFPVGAGNFCSSETDVR